MAPTHSLRIARAIAPLALLFLAACGEAEAPPAEVTPKTEPPWFREEAATRGLTFEHRSGHADSFLFPELMGGGAALFDLEGDGDLDAFLVQSGDLTAPAGTPSGHRLYANRGDGTFEDVTDASGIGVSGYGMGITSGDYDGDGDTDLYVTAVGANTLLENQGGGRLVDVTERAGVGDGGWGTSACFFDMEGDGDLDLFVANYVGWTLDGELTCFGPTGQLDYCGPTAYGSPSVDVLYENRGGGTFVEVTEAAGIGAARGNGLGVVSGDFNGDGLTDLFVANDQTPDRLWINQGEGRFKDQAELAGCARDRNGGSRAGMGVDTADIDDDGDVDILVVHMAREHDGLFYNQGRYFMERTVEVGLGLETILRTRFGVGFMDFDQDGWLDVYVANGRVNLQMEPLTDGDPYAEPNTLLRGTAADAFKAILPHGGTAEPLLATSRGAAFGDVDGDGAVDVLVVNRDGPAQLFMNRVAQRGHWLTVRAVDGEGRDAIGAWIELPLGSRRVRREVKSAFSYCSSSPARAHFGLGDADGPVEVTVRWPDGASEVFAAQAVDRLVVLKRNAGQVR